MKKSTLGLLSLTVSTLGLSFMPFMFNGVNALSNNNSAFSLIKPSEVNLMAQAKNPYDGKGFTATASFKCSVNNASHNKECPGGIMRKSNNSASITVLFPNKKEVTYNFQNCPYDKLQNCKVTSNAGEKLDWGKQGDEWSIGIGGKLFIVIPDAAIYGG